MPRDIMRPIYPGPVVNATRGGGGVPAGYGPPQIDPMGLFALLAQMNDWKEQRDANFKTVQEQMKGIPEVRAANTKALLAQARRDELNNFILDGTRKALEGSDWFRKSAEAELLAKEAATKLTTAQASGAEENVNQMRLTNKALKWTLDARQRAIESQDATAMLHLSWELGRKLPYDAARHLASQMQHNVISSARWLDDNRDTIAGGKRATLAILNSPDMFADSASKHADKILGPGGIDALQLAGWAVLGPDADGLTALSHPQAVTSILDPDPHRYADRAKSMYEGIRSGAQADATTMLDPVRAMQLIVGSKAAIEKLSEEGDPKLPNSGGRAIARNLKAALVAKMRGSATPTAATNSDWQQRRMAFTSSHPPGTPMPADLNFKPNAASSGGPDNSITAARADQLEKMPDGVFQGLLINGFTRLAGRLQLDPGVRQQTAGLGLVTNMQKVSDGVRGTVAEKFANDPASLQRLTYLAMLARDHLNDPNPRYQRAVAMVRTIMPQLGDKDFLDGMLASPDAIRAYAGKIGRGAGDVNAMLTRVENDPDARRLLTGAAWSTDNIFNPSNFDDSLPVAGGAASQPTDKKRISFVDNVRREIPAVVNDMAHWGEHEKEPQWFGDEAGSFPEIKAPPAAPMPTAGPIPQGIAEPMSLGAMGAAPTEQGG